VKLGQQTALGSKTHKFNEEETMKKILVLLSMLCCQIAIADGYNTPNRTRVASSKFAGYIGTATTYSVTNVTGSWTVPSVNCNGSTPRSLFFVGIDGIVKGNTATIEQIGTAALCTNKGPMYYAWYEFIPNEPYQVEITSITVRPGDVITGSVNFNADTDQFTATIVDGTQQPYTTPPITVTGA
jgi:hypothetical protein